MSCGHTYPGLPCPCDAPPLLTPPLNVQFGFLPQLAAAVQVAASAVAVAKSVKGKKKPKAEPVPVYVPPPSVFDAFGPQNRPLVMLGLGGLGLAVILKLTR